MLTPHRPSLSPKPFVFVLMPFATEFNDIYKFGIKGAAEEIGAYAERVDEQMFTEGILDRIFNQISKADVIVADMTGQNPNVFYEVGYAHALGKTVLLITQKAEDIPFDLKHRPHIIYSGKIDSLRQNLTEKLTWALKPDHGTEVTSELLVDFTKQKEIRLDSSNLGRLTKTKTLDNLQTLGYELLPNQVLTIHPEDSHGSKTFFGITSEDASHISLIETPHRPRDATLWGFQIKTIDQAVCRHLFCQQSIQISNIICDIGEEALNVALCSSFSLVFEEKQFKRCYLTHASRDSLNGVPAYINVGRNSRVISPWAAYINDVYESAVYPDASDDIEEDDKWGRAATVDLLKSRVILTSYLDLLQRRLSGAIVIVYDAQQLSVAHLRSLITKLARTSKLILISNQLSPVATDVDLAFTGVRQMTNGIRRKSEFSDYVFSDESKTDRLHTLATAF